MSDYKIGQKPAYVKPPEFALDFRVLNEPLRSFDAAVNLTKGLGGNAPIMRTQRRVQEGGVRRRRSRAR
jgi:hypothetical protein